MIIKKQSEQRKTDKINPWAWVPSLYFAEGLPYVVVITVSVIMYKRLGISNADIALYTSWLYLPWVIKPLWSPLIDVLKTKRFWITTMQLVIGAGMAGVAFTIPMPDFFQFTLAFFWLLAFSSATHDISVDGFYMLSLSDNQQAFFVGIRSTFYRVAMIAGQGLLIILAGYLEGALSVGPAEFKVAASPGKFFTETLKVDSLSANELSGQLRVITRPDYVEISTKPKTREEVRSYVTFAHNFNIMNGFSKEPAAVPDTSNSNDHVGNVGIVKLMLSKNPGSNKEYFVNLNFAEGDSKIKIIEGKILKFTSNNWNKPAFAVFQLDSSITNAATAVYKAQTDKVPLAWVFTFSVIGGLFVLFFVYHRFILPVPADDIAAGYNRQSTVLKEFFRAFARFFEKKKIIPVILFLLFYRLGEAQLVKMAAPFLLDSREAGGLGLSTAQVGSIYGIAGIIALMAGGLLGGYVISRNGLKYWLWPMIFAINIPHILYTYMAFAQPANIWIIYLCVAGEQFGYGFGFTAYMMYMIYISQGDYKTSHYALTTGFMALGMMIPGMFSGMIEEALGYKLFFVWILITIIPTLLIIKFLPLEYQFGKKKNTDT